jgi:hypothetical protein
MQYSNAILSLLGEAPASAKRFDGVIFATYGLRATPPF